MTHRLNILSGILAAALLLSAASFARAAVILSVTPTSPLTVSPGGTVRFNVSLTLTGAEQVTGYDFYLQAAGTGYASSFSIMQRTSNVTQFPDLNNSDTAVATTLNSVLAPVNSLSLGASVNAPFTPVSGTGTYLLSSFTISVGASTPIGAFTISPVNTAWFDQSFNTQSFNSVGLESLTVVSVPEPGTWELCMSAIALLAMIGRGRFVQSYKWPRGR